MSIFTHQLLGYFILLSRVYVLQGNKIFKKNLCKELSTQMHYTTRSKAEPEFLVVKRREHARTVWVGASARGHAHEQPQQLRYNWLPAALFFPTVIKVRSSFQPAESETRRWGSWGCCVLESVFHVRCHQQLNSSHVPWGTGKSYQCYDLTALRSLSPFFSYRLPRLKTISRFYLCNSCVCHRNDLK
jgi:hypothetical protein